MTKFLRSTKKGSAVAYALVVIFAVSIILMSLIQFVTSKAKNAYQSESGQEAFEIAEAGVDWYRWYLAHETDGKTALEVQQFWQGSPEPYGAGTPYVKDYVDSQGGNIGKFSVSVTAPSMGSTIVTAVVTGWTNKYQNIKKQIKVRFRRPAWSEYSVLTNEFTRFGSGWDVKGKLMSNTGIDFNGVAHNAVYAGLTSYYNTDWNKTLPGVYSHDWAPSNYNSDMGSAVFLGGTVFPYAQKDFTGFTADLNMIKSVSMQPNNTTVNGCTSTGCHFTLQGVGRHIILRSDGKFDLKTVTAVYNSSGNNNNYGKIKTESGATTYAIPDNGIIFVDGDTWVEGNVNNSRVTVAAANIPTTGTDANIYIGMNNILYENFDGTDNVGLIAQGNIEVIHDSLNNFTVDAAMLAQDGTVGTIDHNPNCCTASCAGLKNSISFYGSIASNKRLALLLGRNCSQNDLYGYSSRNITYDNNLLYYPPPYFPTGTEYSIDEWNEL